MSFTPLTSSRSLVYTSPSLSYDNVQDLRLEMTNSLESIEACMDHQWDMMLTQLCTQADQMTTILQQLAASTPRPLTPSNLQSPPGTVVLETITEGSEHESDNSTWVQGQPMADTTTSHHNNNHDNNNNSLINLYLLSRKSAACGRL